MTFIRRFILVLFVLAPALGACSDELTALYHQLSTEELPMLQDSIQEAVEEYNQDTSKIKAITKKAYAIWHEKLNKSPDKPFTASARSFVGNLVPDYFSRTIDYNPNLAFLPDLPDRPIHEQVLDLMLMAWGTVFSENEETFSGTKASLSDRLKCDQFRCTAEANQVHGAEDISLALEQYNSCRARRSEELGEHLRILCELLHAQSTQLGETYIV